MKRQSLKVKRIALVLVVVMLMGMGFSSAETIGNNEKVEVIVMFENAPGNAEVALLKAFGGEDIHTYKIIHGAFAVMPEPALNGLRKHPFVSSVELNGTYSFNEVTEADYLSELSNTWGMERIGEAAAHDAGAFGDSIKVAVIDTGINMNHVQLASNYKGGKDLIDGDDYPQDLHGHGTHVAGTIAAIRDGSQIVGAAPNVEIYALRVFSGAEGDDATDDRIIQALEWCVDNGIDVTNSSFGGGAYNSALEEAYNNANTAGILNIAAAGNDGAANGRGDTVDYPARFDSVVAVAAMKEGDSRARFSSTGPDVELIAPGVDIISSYIDADVDGDGVIDTSIYAYMDGTSQATPHVVGVAAQIMGLDSSLSNSDVRNILRSTAEDLGLKSEYQGYGMVSAVNAVNYVLGNTTPPPATTYTLSTSIVGNGTITGTSDGTYDSGTPILITATADSGSHFVKWVIDGVDKFTETQSFELDSNIEAVAYFEEDSAPSVDKTVKVTLDSGVYNPSDVVSISILVTDGTNPMVGESVTVNILDSRNRVIETLTGSSDEFGVCDLSYTVFKRAKSGTYTVFADSDGYTDQVTYVVK